MRLLPLKLPSRAGGCHINSRHGEATSGKCFYTNNLDRHRLRLEVVMKSRKGKQKPRRKPSAHKNTTKAPRTLDQYFGKSRRFQDLWDRVVTVVSKIRGNNTSLQQASREVGISPRTVTKWAAPALRKTTSGRYTAKPTDQLLRVLLVPTTEGPREVAVRGSRKATQVGEYWNAVHRFLETGDRSGLQKFAGKFLIDAGGNRFSFLADRNELKRLGSAGVLSFHSIYGRNV